MNRVLLKTTTYGLMHLSVAVAVAFALTRDWRVALAVGIVEPVVQTFAFAIHERLWSRAGAVPVAPICAHAHDPRSTAEHDSPSRPQADPAPRPA
jgi:uncharacterized membrane protein